MQTEHRVRLLRNEVNQVLPIPGEFELPGDEAIIRKRGDCLIVEPVKKRSLLALLDTLEPLDEAFPDIEDPPAIDAELVLP